MIKPGIDPRFEASFSFRNRIFRVIWSITYTLFFRWTPRVMHGWRSLVLRAFGADIGKNCHIYGKVEIWAPWNLEIGNNVGVADGVVLYAMDKIIIEDDAVVSQGAHLCTGSHDISSRNFQLVTRPILIGGRAWICADVFVHAGVNIPEGAVVGARSVVTKSLSGTNAVFSGNPCKYIKPRYSREYD